MIDLFEDKRKDARRLLHAVMRNMSAVWLDCYDTMAQSLTS